MGGGQPGRDGRGAKEATKMSMKKYRETRKRLRTCEDGNKRTRSVSSNVPVPSRRKRHGSRKEQNAIEDLERRRQ